MQNLTDHLQAASSSAEPASSLTNRYDKLSAKLKAAQEELNMLNLHNKLVKKEDDALCLLVEQFERFIAAIIKEKDTDRLDDLNEFLISTCAGEEEAQRNELLKKYTGFIISLMLAPWPYPKLRSMLSYEDSRIRLQEAIICDTQEELAIANQNHNANRPLIISGLACLFACIKEKKSHIADTVLTVFEEALQEEKLYYFLYKVIMPRNIYSSSLIRMFSLLNIYSETKTPARDKLLLDILFTKVYLVDNYCYESSYSLFQSLLDMTDMKMAVECALVIIEGCSIYGNDPRITIEYKRAFAAKFKDQITAEVLGTEYKNKGVTHTPLLDLTAEKRQSLLKKCIDESESQISQFFHQQKNATAGKLKAFEALKKARGNAMELSGMAFFTPASTPSDGILNKPSPSS